MGDRPDISMSPAEVTAFLASQRRAVVAALDDGAPVGTVASMQVADGEVEVRLHAGDAVRALLAVDDRVCVIAEQFPTYYEIKGVCAHGRARFVEGSDGTVFRVGLDDVTSFDFGKLPRTGKGSGTSA